MDIEPDKSLIGEFLKGGWVITVLGGAGMFARMLYSGRKYSIIDMLRRIVAASIASTIAWYILEQTDIGSLYKAISYGITGVISPEIINGIVKLAKRFEKTPEKFIGRGHPGNNELE